MTYVRPRTPFTEHDAHDEYWMQEIHKVLNTPMTFKHESPTKITNEIYLGNYNDAANFKQLKKLGITYVLNCAAFRSSDANPYPKEAKIKEYLQFPAKDELDHNILQYFSKAKVFLDKAMFNRAKVLVHCAAGINRSAAILTAYLMIHFRWDLLAVLKIIKARRFMVLSNLSFRKQLLDFARNRLTLELPKETEKKLQKGKRPVIYVSGDPFLYVMT